MIEEKLSEDFIERRLKEKAASGKITCPEARRIAEELKVSYRKIGDIINRLGIKITNCDLGCF
jgi:LAO/AO transport system kinase